ncbi:MAG TPA: hypothetical protein VM925_27365 [Labilithrix sp.]|nr:hypothetical protein [Labilithrix sp.]
MNQGPPPGPYGYGPPLPQHYPQHPHYTPTPAAYVQQTTLIFEPPFKHTLHVVLDIVTCGIWIPIHLLCWALY